MIRKQSRHDYEPIDQADTVFTDVVEIAFSCTFGIGIDEVRAGRSPRFDAMNDWNYERGRQFAIILPAKIDHRSMKAIRLLRAAVRRGIII
jgi:hypothetical protein